jgi:Outer membrane protein beta-barrel domain
MQRMLCWTMVIIALVASGATEARAQSGMGAFKGFLTGHIGAIAGADVDEARATVGASVSVHDDTGWGAEFDLGHSADAESGPLTLDVTSYMFNAQWIKPDGVIRPYGLLGGGVLQLDGCASPCSRSARTFDFGLSAGAGALYMLNDDFALRGDLRYFYSSANHSDLGRPDNFNYFRVTFGATFMWSIAP